MKSIKYIIGFGLLFCWLATAGVAQQHHLVVADSFPPDPQHYTVLHMRSRGTVHRYDSTAQQWNTIAFQGIEKVGICNTRILLVSSMYVVVFAEEFGSSVTFDREDFICDDSLYGNYNQLWDNRETSSGANTALTACVSESCLPQKTEFIQGMNAYCAVLPHPKSNTYFLTIECDEIRNWGMIGGNAKWLIEPKYDRPFHFKRGVAEVYYYGQKFKINEYGERLK